MNKLFLLSLILVGVLVVSASVYAYSVVVGYSFSDDIIFPEQREPPILRDCSRDEWNSYFEDYRNGVLTKSKAVELISGCRR